MARKKVVKRAGQSGWLLKRISDLKRSKPDYVVDLTPADRGGNLFSVYSVVSGRKYMDRDELSGLEGNLAVLGANSPDMFARSDTLISPREELLALVSKLFSRNVNARVTYLGDRAGVLFKSVKPVYVAEVLEDRTSILLITDKGAIRSYTRGNDFVLSVSPLVVFSKKRIERDRFPYAETIADADYDLKRWYFE